jgi:Flp pilus assembly protein TadG
MRDFRRNEEGYALVLTLLFMPVFIGLSLMIIDLGRGNNAHSDLYAAADALALAGAVELDRNPTAIPRAKAAMEKLTNSVSFLGLGDGETFVTLNYDADEDNEFNVIFLSDIPDDDDDPIDQAWVDDYGTTDSSEARYVYVAAQSVDLDAIFPVPVSFVREDVPIQAHAVAGRKATACGITPLFICNPFESDNATDPDLFTAFSEGQLHGRAVQLHPAGPDTAGPGNFSFLALPGSKGKNDLRKYMAGDGALACFDASEVETEPGAATSINVALNTRFDMWEQFFSGKQASYSPSINVRKGYKPEMVDIVEPVLDADGNPVLDADGNPVTQVTGTEPDYCSVENDTSGDTMGLPPNNDNMANPGNPLLGGFLGNGDWDFEEYMAINHPDVDLATFDEDEINSFPNAASPGIQMPSRYDVYKWENELPSDRIANESAGGEYGTPMCVDNTEGAQGATDDPERRVIQAAVINCNTHEPQGRIDLPVLAYASLFLVNPVLKKQELPTDADGYYPDGTINTEVIDISGKDGLGTLDNFLKVEAVLVR